MQQNYTLTFVAGCYIPHLDSNFYTCLDKDNPFNNLEEDIAYSKGQGEVIVLGDMNARTRTMQQDTHQIGMSHESRSQEETHMYNRESNDAKEPDKYGKALLHMCNSTGLLIANGTPLWQDTGDFTCRKHNGDSVIDYMLLPETTLDCIQNFTLGKWSPESDHRCLCIELKCNAKLKHASNQQRVEKTFLRMDVKRALMYANMVDERLWKTQLPLDATLEGKWKVFKQVFCSCAEACLPRKPYHTQMGRNGTKREKNGLI